MERTNSRMYRAVVVLNGVRTSFLPTPLLDMGASIGHTTLPGVFELAENILHHLGKFCGVTSPEKPITKGF